MREERILQRLLDKTEEIGALKSENQRLNETIKTLKSRIAELERSPPPSVLLHRPSAPITIGDDSLPIANDSDSILLADLPLSIRIINAMTACGIQTVGQVLNHSEADISTLPNIGRGSLKELRRALASLGLTIGMRAG